MPHKELEEEKKHLIEKLGVYFEEDKHLPPLAARILSTLVLNGRYGTSFEKLVSELEASKSTICTHLNSLIAQQRVAYFTKSGDRKRYFTIASGYITQKIELLITHWNTEIELHKQVLSYKSAFNKAHPSQPLSLSFHENAVKFLHEAIAYFQKQAKHYQHKEKIT